MEMADYQATEALQCQLNVKCIQSENNLNRLFLFHILKKHFLSILYFKCSNSCLRHDIIHLFIQQIPSLTNAHLKNRKATNDCTKN